MACCFVDDEQLADQLAMTVTLEPYLRKSWTTLSGKFDPESVQANGHPSSSSRTLPRPKGILDDLEVVLQQAPRMTIAILVVGTRGDVQPFLRLGQRLKADGHRVRLATHDQYQEYVLEGGLEFYPLGGDPKKLSMYMCKSGGRLMPNILSKEERHEMTEKMHMLEEMMLNTWPAASQPFPPEGPRFLADAIIANPVAYGHVHVAEKLDIPVHLMFPQPWSPTGEIPHPLSIWGRSCTHRSFRPEGLDAAFRRAQNLSTYYAVDEFLYTGMRFMTNNFRMSMGLKKIMAGQDGAHIINTHEVPFAYQWSPLILPCPADYGPHLEVTGTIFSEETSYQPPPELQAWLQACRDEGNLPVFVGFGSMIVSRPEALVHTILQAARDSDTRVLLQSSWSGMAVAAGDHAERFVHQIGNCPHDWLFKQVTAVVHHGGAGTAAAGLRAGVPTMICPFFGDQYLWAQALHHEGLSVEPVPIQNLTPRVLAESFVTLRGLDEKGSAIRIRCCEVGELLRKEDGVAGAVSAFYRHLPLDGLVCEMSLMLRPQRDVRMARWYSPRLGLKICPEAYLALRSAVPEDVFEKCSFQRYHYSMAWNFANPVNFMAGLTQALRHAAVRYTQAGAGLVVEPVQGTFEGGRDHGFVGALQGGLRGTARGLVHGLEQVKTSTRRLFTRPLKGLRSKRTGVYARGPRPVHSDEDNHRFEPHSVVAPDESRNLLEAYKGAQGLRQAWARHAPSPCQAGDHELLPVSAISKLLDELEYPAEVWESLSFQLGVPVDWISSSSGSGSGEGDAPEERGFRRWLRRLEQRVNAFTGQIRRGRRRRHARPLEDLGSEVQVSFCELAALLQPFGPSPKVQGAGVQELLVNVLSGSAG